MVSVYLLYTTTTPLIVTTNNIMIKKKSSKLKSNNRAYHASSQQFKVRAQVNFGGEIFVKGLKFRHLTTPERSLGNMRAKTGHRGPYQRTPKPPAPTFWRITVPVVDLHRGNLLLRRGASRWLVKRLKMIFWYVDDGVLIFVQVYSNKIQIWASPRPYVGIRIAWHY